MNHRPSVPFHRFPYLLLLPAVLVALLPALGCATASMPPSAGPLASSSALTPGGFIYPQNNSASVDPLQPFQWIAVKGATYTLNVGTKPLAQDVYSEANLLSNVTRRTVWGLLPGQRYYASLYVYLNGVWSEHDISFQTTNPKNPGPLTRAALYNTISTLTGQVRLSTKDLTNYPLPDTPLSEEIAAFGLTGASCTNFADTLVRLLAENGIYSRRVSLVIVDWITHVLVEYYDPYSSGWSVADPTFGVVYFDNDLDTGQSAAQLSQDIVSENFSDIKAQFVTPNGPRYMNAYMLDPVTNFLNVVPQGAYIPDAAKNSPFQYLIATSPGQTGCFEIRLPNGSDTATVNSPATAGWTVGQVELQPWDSSGWAPTICLNMGWTMNAPAGSGVYAFRRVLF